MASDSIRGLFDAIDTDKDGLISVSELSQRLRLPLDSLPPSLHGPIDFPQFTSIYRSALREDDEEGDLVETEEDMKEAFDAFDEDGNGFISANELRSVLSKMGLLQNGSSVEECEDMIRKVDKDGNGEIDFLEFKQMMGFFRPTP